MDIGLLIMMTLLLSINVIIMGYMFFVLGYNKKGLEFLEYAKTKIHDNNDDMANRAAVQDDINTFINTIPIMKSRISFLLFILNINVAMLSFAFFPVLLVTDAWSTISFTGAILNACMITMFVAASKTKNKIDATCMSYDVLLTAYKYANEQEKNNDSTG